MPATSEQLWDAIYRIGTEDGTAEKIQPPAVSKLIEFKIVELSLTGLPQFIPYGQKCFAIMESGNGSVPELNALAAIEYEQMLGDGQPID